jgi:orotate phosphoribosyltransferase
MLTEVCTLIQSSRGGTRMLAHSPAADAKAIQEKWITKFRSLNAWWQHDGDLEKPFVLLTKGNISSLYANCSKITSRPHILAVAIADLLSLMPPEQLAEIDAIVGSSYGANTIAYEIARQLVKDAWFTIKGEKNGEMALDRFEFSIRVHGAVMAEDVITTFGTTRASIKSIRQKIKEQGAGASPVTARILPFVFSLVNRSGMREIDGYKIISLITIDAPMWKPGRNPHTRSGREHVPPVRPKQIWSELTHH